MQLYRYFKILEKLKIVIFSLADAGQILNGLAGPVGFCGGILISDRWFPPKERSTATAIGVIISYLGNTMCFLICPSIVPQPEKNHHHNNTNIFINITKFSGRPNSPRLLDTNVGYNTPGLCILMLSLL